MITRIFIEESLGWVRKPNSVDVFTHPHHEGILLWQDDYMHWHLKRKGEQSSHSKTGANPTETEFMEWMTVHVSKIKGANELPWWEKAAADWQDVRARGEALRSEQTLQSKIESKARVIAAGIDNDYAYLMERVGDWPGEELNFLEAVEETGNYDVRPWDDPSRPSCSCHISPPCDTCTNGAYWIDWRVGG